MRRAFLWIFGLCLSCEGAAEQTRLDIPLTGAHQSAIVAVEHGDQLQLFARAVENGSIAPIDVPFSRSSQVDITAILYSQDLQSFGLQESQLQTTADRSEGRPLPPSTDIWTARVLGTDQSPFSKGALPAPLTEINVMTQARCLPITEGPTTAVSGNLTVFIALNDGVLLMNRHEEGVPQIITYATPEQNFSVPSIEMPGFGTPEFRSGFAADNNLWFAVGNEGGIWSARFSPDTKTLEDIVPRGAVLSHEEGKWFAGPPNVKPDSVQKLFVMTREEDYTVEADAGNLNVFQAHGDVDSTAERIMYIPAQPGAPWRRVGNVAHVSDREVIALWPYDQYRVLRFRETDISFEWSSEPTSVGAIPQIGALLGTKAGELLFSRDQEWTPLSEGNAAITALNASTLGGPRVYFSDAEGRFKQHALGVGDCPGAVSLDSPARQLLLTPDYVVAILAPAEGETGVRLQWLLKQ